MQDNCPCVHFSYQSNPRNPVSGRGPKSPEKRFHKRRGAHYKCLMNILARRILFIAAVALVSVTSLSNEAVAADFEQARVTQVVQDVKVLPSSGTSRQAAVNETLHKG